MVNNEKNIKEPIDYQRREVIKYLAKIGAGATFGGLVGGFIGKTYKTGRDMYQNTIVPTVKKGEEILDKTKRGFNNLLGYFSGKKPEEEPETKQKNIDRRGFFNLFLKYFNKNPIFTGTGMGMTYGGTKSSITGYNIYKTKKQIAELREKVDEQEKIIKNIEGQRNQEGGLEREVEEILPLIIGIVGGVVSIFNLKPEQTITGFSILRNVSTQGSFLALIGLIISILLIIIGLILLRKNKK